MRRPSLSGLLCCLVVFGCSDLANPDSEALEYCVSQGGRVEVRVGPAGESRTVCAFHTVIEYDEGSVLDSWACDLDDFYAGTCEEESEGPDLVQGSGQRSMSDSVVSVVKRLMGLVDTTHYTNGGYVTDTVRGRFDLDCSYWAKQVLTRVSPFHYDEIPKSSASGTTALAADYFDHFNSLSASDSLWERVPNISQARAGDIIAYAHDPAEGASTTGHVMILMSTPRWSTCSDTLQHWVWVSDAARSGHGDDTRNGLGKYADDYDYVALPGSSNRPSGVGLGKMWFNTGTSPYYRWSKCSSAKQGATFAIGRLRTRP